MAFHVIHVGKIWLYKNNLPKVGSNNFQNHLISMTFKCCLLINSTMSYGGDNMQHLVDSFKLDPIRTFIIHNFGKLDKKIQKDATSKVSSKPGTGKNTNASVPSIVVHNGSPTILCSSAEAPSGVEGPQQQIVGKGEDLRNLKTSMSEEPIVNQHGPTMNNLVTAQRPTNCLPPVTPPVRQNSLNTAPAGGSRNLSKSISVPSRSKVDRTVNKQDSFETDGGMTTGAQRLQSNPKVKLLQRSHAVREETSPPRELDPGHTSPNNSNETLTVNKTINGLNSNNNNNTSNHINNNNSNSNNVNTNSKVGNAVSQASNPNFQSSNSLQVNNNISRPSSRHKLRHQGSSQGSMENSSPCLSRDSSTEQYTDNSGIDLNQFIADTLNRNYKDRILLLQIEQDLISFVKDAKRAYQKFPVMSSYQRMLVHRVAAFFGMDHNVDQSGNCVVVNMTSSTRIPEVRFSELIRDDCRYSEEPRRCILKRDSSSFEEGMQLRSPERQLSGDSRRSKSFEEREEEYERARKRIFNRDDGLPIGSPYRTHDTNSRRNSHEDLRWHGESQPWSSSDSDICTGKGRQTSTTRSNRISKVESFEGNDTLKANSLKGSVSKSYSFGGYPGMTRGDSVSSASSRALIKQADSVTSSVSSARLSPSSSGYKSQSVRSDATASTTPSPNQAASQCSFSPEPNTVVWAVSSLTAVPPGAVLINPASGQPYTNPDGSLYRYDPDNPIKLCPTIEEDVPTNTLSSPASGVLTNSDTLANLIEDKASADTFAGAVNLNSENAEVTSDKANTVLINSSTSPSLPELPVNNATATKDHKLPHSEGGRVEGRKFERPVTYQEEMPRNNANSGHLYSNAIEIMSAEVAQNNFNGIESDNSTYNNNAGGSAVSGATTTCQEEGKEYPGQGASMTYPVNYAVNSNIPAPEYGSQAASSGAFLNSSVGVTPINYAVGPSYSTETMHMAPDMLYSQSVVYTPGQQGNPYGVVHPTAAPTTPVAPPPPPPAGPASAPAPAYETRPNENNPNMSVPELSNYFMGLNVGNESIPQTATPAPQLGYWGPSPNTSQAQGSNHSSQIQMYYLPGSLPAGAIHPKYTPAAASMYTYNVPPLVYPTDICQSIIPSTATALFQTPYYAPGPSTTMSYRAPTPPTPSAVAATAVAPTSFLVYHPQPAPAAAPPPQPLHFGMVRPQQQVPGIRSSPPSGSRARMPHNRPVSERARHGSLNVDPKTSNLHFSSPLSVYGLRLMPGDIQPLGMMRPVASVRPVATTSSSNPGRHPVVTQCCTSDLTSSRPPRPRKQR